MFHFIDAWLLPRLPTKLRLPKHV